VGSLARWQIFAILVAVVAACALVGQRTGGRVFDDLWSQLFWLVAGVLLTTFVLESLLTRDLDARRKREDLFAFQTFTATLLDLLVSMTDRQSDVGRQSMMVAAVRASAEFGQTAKMVVSDLDSARELVSAKYLETYIHISNELRGLAVGYIRVFSRSREEMVELYSGLVALASRWVYRDELSDGARRYVDSLADSDPNKDLRRRAAAQHEREALALVRDTASYLADLARRANLPGATLRP
jgi:hypothetical protein